VAPAEPTASGAPSFRRALAHPPFLFLWLSQLVSQSGDFVFEVALIWLVLESTHSILAVTSVVVVAILPTVLLGPFLGVYADRWPRRTILLGTNLAEGVLVAALSGLVLAHDASFLLILVVVFALSVGGQFVRVTVGAMTPQTVSKDDLGPANGLQSFSTSSTQIVGLSIGGIVVALFGVTLPITYDAISFFAAALLVLLIARSVGRPEPAPDGAVEGFFAQFREGVAFLAGQRYLLEICLLGCIVNFSGNAMFALWAPYADLVLHGGAATYGFLGAMIALGAIVGAVVAGKLAFRDAVGRVALAGLFGFGVLAVVLGLTDSIPVALGVSFAVGILTSVINLPLLSAIQAKVPERLLGRVMSAFLSLVLVAAPFGAYFAGIVAVRTSVGLVFVVAGILVLATAGFGAVAMRAVRELRY
jgi:MFS transporter, DHA3 family, macrolide efflux protein